MRGSMCAMSPNISAAMIRQHLAAGSLSVSTTRPCTQLRSPGMRALMHSQNYTTYTPHRNSCKIAVGVWYMV